jgi:hypothetical protein
MRLRTRYASNVSASQLATAAKFICCTSQVDRGTKTSQSLSFLLESSIPAPTASDDVRMKHRENVMAAMSKVKQKTENLRAQAKNGFRVDGHHPQ